MARLREDPEESGDGYFASVSDLMVGILFVFLLMLAVFAIKYADEDKDKVIEQLRATVKERDVEIVGLKQHVASLTAERNDLQGVIKERDGEIVRLRQQIDDLIRRLDRLRGSIAELVKQLDGVRLGLEADQERLQAVRTSLLQTLKERLQTRGVEVELDANQGILRLSSKGLFEFGKDEFTVSGKDNAKALLQEMAQLLPCYSQASESPVLCASIQPIFETVLIEGHTDNARTARPDGNWALSTDRARAFLNLIIDSTPSLHDLRNNSGQRLIGLAGYGDSRLRNDIPGNDEGNRRIEVRFLLSGERGNLQGRIRRLEDLMVELQNLARP